MTTLSVDTVRRIERGVVANPGIFTVSAIASELGLSLDDLVAAAAHEATKEQENAD